jgi:hypothetical protein
MLSFGVENDPPIGSTVVVPDEGSGLLNVSEPEIFPLNVPEVVPSLTPLS